MTEDEYADAGVYADESGSCRCKSGVDGGDGGGCGGGGMDEELTAGSTLLLLLPWAKA